MISSKMYVTYKAIYVARNKSMKSDVFGETVILSTYILILASCAERLYY